MNPIRKTFLGGVAAVALTGAFVAGGNVSLIQPVFAEAVKVEAPQAPSFADVVEAVSPAVVSVRVKASVKPASNDGNQRGFREGFGNLPEGHPLRRFFEDQQRANPRRDRRSPRNFGTSQGSGFFVSDDGYVVTNNHVVANGDEFTIVMNDGVELDAKMIGTDPKTDLAVLKVERAEKFTYVDFAQGKSRVGEWVVAVGNPFGLGGTVTAGIVSAAGRDIGSGPYDDFLQIDAAVNKGNSGGPAFNLRGEVIGVNTAIFSPSGGNVGIAFAISAKTSKEVVGDLIREGSVTRGWLGVAIQPVSEDIADSLGLDSATGAIVSEASPGSPADKAGMLSRDVIVAVDGKNVKDAKALSRMIAAYEPDEIVKIEVVRNGEKRVIDVTLGTLDQPKEAAAGSNSQPDEKSAIELSDFGMSIIPDEDGVRVSSVEQNGAAAEKGLRVGDLIVSVNGKETRSVTDVGQAVAQAMEDDRKAVLFQLRNNERNRFIALPVNQG
ncbi:Do family serine endopeptidase [Ahrensia sp. R2A130]|uniref:Do family serine endopeptidase n=1 Tax=Ahrensia sp. R2A130 TaxID=744979 RepID=UPI0001E0E8D4|nr:Do family serine endopeptidase [Ahrensia sp. R2A130]EFL88978.1 serine protease [Ahrensia sp. R2A130]